MLDTESRHAGFSLVEALCAIIILGVGLVGITEAITMSLRATADARHYTTAAMLTSSQLELLRAEGFLIEGEDDGDFGEDFAAYTWTRTIRETDREGLHDVVVRVHLEPSGEVLVELRTLLFDMPYESLTNLDDDATSGRDGRSSQGSPRSQRLRQGGRRL